MVNVNDLAITSLETITAFGTDGEYLFTLDELQDATIAQSQEKTDITGKGGRKLTSLKKNKSVTISGNNGLISGGLLELQTGGEFQTNISTTVQWTDYVTAKTGASNKTVATLSYAPYGSTGSQIQAVYVKKADGTVEDKNLVQDAAAASGKFAYDATTSGTGKIHTLTFANSDVPDGTNLVVLYQRQITGSVLKNDSDTYSKKAALYVDAFAEDKCNNTYRVQFFIPKADFNGEFSIELGGDQAVHAFEAEALSGACGTGGELWTYTVFGSDAADV